MAEEVKKEKGEINLYDTVKVTGAKGAKYLKEGKEYTVHPNHAEQLVKNSEAVLKKDTPIINDAPTDLKAQSQQDAE